MWHNVHSQQHTYMSSSYRSSRLGLSHWNPYAMHWGICLELYYCNMVEWCCWDSSLICKTNWFPSVLWHCWFGHMTCKNCPRYDLLCVWWDVKPCSVYQFSCVTMQYPPLGSVQTVDKQNIEHLPHDGRLTSMLESNTSSKWLFYTLLHSR